MRNIEDAYNRLKAVLEAENIPSVCSDLWDTKDFAFEGFVSRDGKKSAEVYFYTDTRMDNKPMACVSAHETVEGCEEQMRTALFYVDLTLVGDFEIHKSKGIRCLVFNTLKPLAHDPMLKLPYPLASTHINAY